MSIYQIRQLSSTRTPDDSQIFVIRRDLSGGVNTRQHGTILAENQSYVLYNIDISVVGQTSKRFGSVLIGNDVSNNSVIGLHNFIIQGDTDQLLMYEGTYLRKWVGSGNWATLKSDFSASTEVGMINAKQSGISPDDIVVIQNGVDNGFILDSNGNLTDVGSADYYSMPKTTVMCWYGNRIWLLKNDLLYWSDAYSSDYIPRAATITGDIDTFTGVSGDKIKITIDETEYDNIDLSACTDIDDVVLAINTVTGGTEAEKDDDGYLKLTSQEGTVGLLSYLKIEDGSEAFQAVITGDQSTFTGTSGDKITVKVDGNYYYNIDISLCSSIADVVTAINTAVGATVASEDGSSYLVITSQKYNSDSSCAILDGYSTTQTVIAKLFSDSDDRTSSYTINSIANKLFENVSKEAYGNTPFDTVSNVFRIPVGEERGIVPTRDTGMVIMGKEAIWGIAPSTTPAATDKPEPLVTSHGVVSKNGWVNAGDDIYYFAQDGFRALQRTMLDKLQTGQDYPLSYLLKEEFERIDWEYIDRLSMVSFDNKIFISVPTSATTFDTWIYFVALKSFTIAQGWSPRSWTTYKIDGQEFLYYGKQGDGKVYRAWYGYTDEGTTTTNGTAINYQEEGRKEDGGQPLVKKVGGEITVKAKASGDYDLLVYASFDDGGYNLLGEINLTGNLITFPVTFPVIFKISNIVTGKFHIDSYGEWYNVQIKIVHNDTNSNDEISVLERNIVTYPIQYTNEGD